MVHTLMMENICTSLYHGWWFSPRTTASSITKTGRHDIAENGAKTPKIKIKCLIYQYNLNNSIYINRMDYNLCS